MSPAQLAANRRNAQHSTGPKTANGKAVAKLNALKHGVLAQTVVVRGHQFKESGHDFEQLHREFYADLAPVGAVEEMLVDKIVTATWRLRRARRAESGQIALSVDDISWKREKDDSTSKLMSAPEEEWAWGLFIELHNSVYGCKYLIHLLEKIRKVVLEKGELTEESVTDYKIALRRQPGTLGDKLDELRNWLVANPGKLEPEVLRSRHQAEVLEFLNGEISNMERWRDRRQEREDDEARAKEAAAVLPSSEVLDKILRYETALERQLYRAMNQLERLQRRRQGEHIPAPLTMDIGAKV